MKDHNLKKRIIHRQEIRQKKNHATNCWKTIKKNYGYWTNRNFDKIQKKIA